jgi:hypothetical protein
LKTQKQKLLELLKEFGLEPWSDNNSVVLEVGDKKVTGYGVFYSLFQFTEDGGFESLHIAE